MLAPVVICGPQSPIFKKPVIISFHHCASIKQGQWVLSVYGSGTSYDEPPQWQVSRVLHFHTLYYLPFISYITCPS